MNRIHLKFLAILLLFTALGFSIYSNTLDSPFVFDDLARIKENPYIHLTQLNFKDILKVGFSKRSSKNRPIGNISFALNYYFHKYDLRGYHVVNIIIHVLTGFFLYWFLKITLNLPTVRSRYEHPDLIAFFAALLWLVHPVNTQSVTYIVQRLNSMAAMFYVLSLLLYLNGRLTQTKPKSWLWFVGSAFSWILALGCKQNSATLPFFVFLYEWYFFQNLNREWLKHKLKYFIGIIIIFGFIALLYLGPNPLEKFTSFKDFSNKEFTFTERVLTQFRVVIYYLNLFFFPHPSRLNLDYDYPLSHSLFNPLTTLLSLCFIIGSLGLAVFLAKKERLISFGIFWFFGTLVIESSILPLAIIFEHRTYLPYVLVGVVPVLLIYRYIKIDWLKLGLLSAVLILFSIWTFERNRDWKDDVTIWADAVKKSPNKARPHNNLGEALAKQEKTDEAINHYLKALQIKPNFAEAYQNLGVALGLKGKTDEAINSYHKALEIRPGYAKAHMGLGVELFNRNRVEEAIDHYYKALKLNPGSDEAHNNLCGTFLKLGNPERAINHCREALRTNPLLAEAHNNLGISLMQAGPIDQAIEHFREALRINPEFSAANNNIQGALAIQKKIKEDMEKIQKALINDPDNPALHYELGILFIYRGKLDKAVNQFKKVILLRPQFSQAQNELAWVYAKKEEYRKAISLFYKLLEKQPENAVVYYNLACMYSRLNKPKVSFDWLRKAIDKGYNRWDIIKYDSDLANLRKTPYYEEIVKGH
jgi:Flp pilus assembly protein TadD